ncbi:MAG TPA: class I SAM-dependent methyltransferase, partial [Longimicrobiales bacterium]|nr:class I SAM-dependent methyltransferase [Longimicrobiales bacterium]
PPHGRVVLERGAPRPAPAATEPDRAFHMSDGVVEHADVEAATDAYAARFAGPVGEWFLDVQGRTMLTLLPGGPEHLRVLDVGGGHAQLVPYLLRAGHDVTVLGSQPGCAARLTEWLDGRRCRFHVGNLADTPYPDAAFDVVLSFRMLAHVADWRAFLGELCRVAARSVIVDFASLRSLNRFAGATFGLKRRLETDTRTFRTFHPAMLRDAFAGNGFHVAGSKPQYALPMVLHRTIGSIRVARALEGVARRAGLTRRLGSPIIVRADREPGLARPEGRH